MAIVVTARIARQILVIRDHKVIFDADLAALYGVPSKRLNEQVKRNAEGFAADIVFQLSRTERDEVVANCDHLHLERMRCTVDPPAVVRILQPHVARSAKPPPEEPHGYWFSSRLPGAA